MIQKRTERASYPNLILCQSQFMLGRSHGLQASMSGTMMPRKFKYLRDRDVGSLRNPRAGISTGGASRGLSITLQR